MSHGSISVQCAVLRGSSLRGANLNLLGSLNPPCILGNTVVRPLRALEASWESTGAGDCRGRHRTAASHGGQRVGVVATRRLHGNHTRVVPDSGQRGRSYERRLTGEDVR